MDSLLYRKQEDLEDRHWWFTARRAVVRRLLAPHLPPRPLKILDLGSGSGGMVPLLASFGEVFCVEINRDLHPALRRHGARRILRLDIARRLPKGRYDLVTLFDVLEHLDDDTGLLRRISRTLLEPEGLVAVTVPAFPWLWSPHDDLNHHRRRYTRAELLRKAAEAGLRPVRSTYFFSGLFPFAVLSRLTLRLRRQPATDLAMPPAPLNTLLHALAASEFLLFPRLDRPFGSSLFALFRRPGPKV